VDDVLGRLLFKWNYDNIISAPEGSPGHKEMTDAQSSGGGVYPIRTVSDLTGINPVTLRAWERRYGLIIPERTPAGHRLYTEDQIDDIRRAIALVKQGVSISQVKRLLRSEESPRRPLAIANASGDPWEAYRQRMLTAVARFDEGAMDTIYNDALSLYPVDLLTRYLVVPLMEEMRQRPMDQPVGEAEVRFFQTYLRNKLGARFHHQNTQARGPRLMAACLPGEPTTLELLLFGLSATIHGYRLVLLGTNVPLNSLPLAVERSGSRGLILLGNQEPPSALLRTHLPLLAKEVPVPLFLCGHLVREREQTLKRAGITPLVAEAQDALHQIDEELAAHRKA
jgi:MerR family transcriptional regulator, light-induced transcriptional regulator